MLLTTYSPNLVKYKRFNYNFITKNIMYSYNFSKYIIKDIFFIFNMRKRLNTQGGNYFSRLVRYECVF